VCFFGVGVGVRAERYGRQRPGGSSARGRKDLILRWRGGCARGGVTIGWERPGRRILAHLLKELWGTIQHESLIRL